MRHAQQIQRTRFANPHQFGKKLRRIVNVFDDFGTHHTRRRCVGNR